MQRKTVCVLGTGIVGLATAYELNRQGFAVTLVDSAPEEVGVGSGASGGNGAQLSYSYVQPLADASIWGQLPKLLLSTKSPLKVRPQWDPQQWRWALDFMRACNNRTSSDTTAALLNLAVNSRAVLEKMMNEHKIVCNYANNGKLVLYATPASYAMAQRQMALQKPLGSPQQALTATETCNLEPALASYRTSFAGAIYTPSECVVYCLKLCQGLEKILLSRGVRFLFNTKVLGFETKLSGKISNVIALKTDDLQSQVKIEADIFVLSLGSDSPRIAKSIGLRLPIYPIKGYSLTFDVESTAAATIPNVSITDASQKVVFARLGNRLRIAGMAELVGHNKQIDTSAIQRLASGAATVFPHLKGCAMTQPWAGLRPATPTGLPIVGVQPKGPSNLVVNTGHGALGLTLAFGTANKVAQICAQNGVH
jgi:D-amino-acid dehydrogenase